MNTTQKVSLLLIALTIIFMGCKQDGEKELKSKPNIIYILADDLGYGELGCYGQKKIETPNIDKLAETGIKFTQHYSGSAVCAPSRCMMLTGLHAGHAMVRGNHEWGSRGDVWSYEAMIKDSTLEGQYPMPDTTLIIAQLLKEGGYVTGMIGKWGLGAPHTNSIPNKMGFDFFSGYNCQRIAHTYYPVFLYKNEHRVYLNNDTVKPHIRTIEDDANPYDIKSYNKFNLKEYAPDVMHKEALNFIQENKDKPFFLYYATPIPHLPLQAPKKWVDYYVNKFGDEKPLEKVYYYPQRYPRAAYAAMISYLDEQVGEIVAKLKELGIYENTLIIFTSDNGPTYIEVEVEWFKSVGSLNVDRKRLKGYLYEGGIRVPMIASWPEKIKKGTQTDHISAFWDVMPTFCDLADILPPDYTDGISFLPVLLGEEQKEHDHLYWEFPSYGGQQAVRMGKWKGIRNNIKKGNTEIELYNLEKDIKELNNLAEQYPDIVKKIEEIMKEEHTQSDIERFKMEAIGDVLDKHL
ncbi:MAG: N-acetylgalactosamine-6-sulfatase [Bacteroidetes bacterium]|nr:MAG: N-acetylgalactosamine-6-sulfatase [Bacteroidota bacterium]